MAILCEYFFLVVNIVYIVKTIVTKKKKGQKLETGVKFHYKWVRETQDELSN